MIAIYHSGTSLKIQQHVLASLKDPRGSVWIVIATGALGMGVDLKCLHQVINYSPLIILNHMYTAFRQSQIMWFFQYTEPQKLRHFLNMWVLLSYADKIYTYI